MSEGTLQDLIGVAGAVALLIFWLRNRRFFSSLSRHSTETDQVLKEAMKLEKTDPAAADRLLDQHFRQQAEVKARAMDDLRSRARDNLQSALELYAKLEERLQTDSLLRKEIVRSFPKSQRATALAQLDDSHQDTQRELEDLQALIKDLQSR